MILENSKYRLEISLKAAEIHSFFDKENQIEYMYDGDPAYWTGRNPILFPIIKSSYDRHYHFDDITTEMGNHGFCRYSDFELLEQNENSLTLSLKANNTTLAQYPYEFELRVKYVLENNKVTIFYRVFNNDQKDLPFAFGLHPAFKCPLEENKKFDDYYFEFSSNIIVPENSLGPYQTNDKVKKVSKTYENLHNHQEVMMENCPSAYLGYSDGRHGVNVSLVGFEKVNTWTQLNVFAPFVCIEPWQPNKLSEIQKDLPFIERDASRIIKPNHSYLASYTIEVF